MRKPKKYTKKELGYLSNPNLSDKQIASLTNRTAGAIYAKRKWIREHSTPVVQTSVVKATKREPYKFKTISAVKEHKTIDTKIKEISVNGITISIVGNKLNITI